jgi:hypothetical protein
MCPYVIWRHTGPDFSPRRFENNEATNPLRIRGLKE